MNNAIEALHCKLNSQNGRSHPRINSLIKCLKSEAEKSTENMVRMKLNLEGIKMKKKFTELDKRTAKNTIRFKEDSDVGKFLKTTSYITKLD